MEIEFVVTALNKTIEVVLRFFSWLIGFVTAYVMSLGVTLEQFVIALFGLSVILPSVMVLGKRELREEAPRIEAPSPPEEEATLVPKWVEGRDLSFYQVLHRISRAALDALEEVSREVEVSPDIIDEFRQAYEEVLRKSEEKIREMEEVIRLREEMERRRMEIVRELRREFAMPPERPPEVAPRSVPPAPTPVREEVVTAEEVPEVPEVPEAAPEAGESESVIKEISKGLEEQLKRLRKVLKEE
ncbi:MAG: hypothetical protein ACTSXJ_02745 [Candidatus Baldrarchaeia archaeon]